MYASKNLAQSVQKISGAADLWGRRRRVFHLVSSVGLFGEGAQVSTRRPCPSGSFFPSPQAEALGRTDGTTVHLRITTMETTDARFGRYTPAVAPVPA